MTEESAEVIYPNRYSVDIKKGQPYRETALILAKTLARWKENPERNPHEVVAEICAEMANGVAKLAALLAINVKEYADYLSEDKDPDNINLSLHLILEGKDNEPTRNEVLQFREELTSIIGGDHEIDFWEEVGESAVPIHDLLKEGRDVINEQLTRVSSPIEADDEQFEMATLQTLHELINEIKSYRRSYGLQDEAAAFYDAFVKRLYTVLESAPEIGSAVLHSVINEIQGLGLPRGINPDTKLGADATVLIAELKRELAKESKSFS